MWEAQIGERGRNWCHSSFNHKLVFGTKFWIVYLADNITLISKDEVEGSAVSKSEADKVTAWKAETSISSLEKQSPWTYGHKCVLLLVSTCGGEEGGGGCTSTRGHGRCGRLGTFGFSARFQSLKCWTTVAPNHIQTKLFLITPRSDSLDH